MCMCFQSSLCISAFAFALMFRGASRGEENPACSASLMARASTRCALLRQAKSCSGGEGGSTEGCHCGVVAAHCPLLHKGATQALTAWGTWRSCETSSPEAATRSGQPGWAPWVTPTAQALSRSQRDWGSAAALEGEDSALYNLKQAKAEVPESSSGFQRGFGSSVIGRGKRSAAVFQRGSGEDVPSKMSGYMP